MSHAHEWEVLDDELPLLGARYGRVHVRMIAVGLGGGRLLVVSPAEPLDAAMFEELERHGKPRWLLAPNHFHNAGLVPWRRRYPDVRVAAHPRARPRLMKKFPELGTIEDLDALRAELPEGVRLFGPPMAKQGETFVSAKTKHGTAWIVCDAIVNDRKYPWWMGLFGFRPGLMTNPFFKRLFLEDKAGYKRWLLEELSKDPPSLLVPCHGQVARGPDLVEQLRRITNEA